MLIPVAQLVIVILVAGATIGGVVLIGLAVQGRQRVRELAYRERIAMIEKGLMPSPETDPARFEALMAPPRPLSNKAQRYRTAGVVFTGLGLAQGLLLFFVVPQIRSIAIGVGGAITIVGLTLLANALLMAGDEPEGSSRNTSVRG